jgi:Cytochrome c554 and c-prime
MRRSSAIVVFVTLLALPALLILSLSDRRTQSRYVFGQVIDDAGPVGGAVVRIKGKRDFSHTDADGHFRLPRPPTVERITAAKEGYFIAGIPSDAEPLLIRLTRLPSEDCARYAWRDPTPDPTRPLNCGNCHQAIYDEWSAGGHARSSTNLHFVNLYDGTDHQGRADRGWNLLKEHPDGAGVCAACHAPTLPPNPQADFDLRAALKGNEALSGVHCDFCHKVRGPGSGEYGLTHGRFQLELLRPDLANTELSSPHGELVFGPLDDVDRGDDAFSPFQRDSRLCAACHEGIVFGVRVYTTYSEWQLSPAKREGKSCQSCHMAPTGHLTNIAPGNGGIERDPRTLGNHRFFADSQVEMLRRSLKLDTKTERTADCVRVEVSLSVNDVGHRVPTGFVDRQVILILEPIGGDSITRLLSGPILAPVVGAPFAGQPGRLYAKVLRDFGGHSPAPFWRADPDYLLDTRLKPGESDTNTWTFPPQTRSVRVRLLHRRFWQSIADVKGWTDNETSIFERVVPVP